MQARQGTRRHIHHFTRSYTYCTFVLYLLFAQWRSMAKQPIGMSDTPSMCVSMPAIQKSHHITHFFVYFRIFCRDPEPFDWYQRYSGVRDLINQYIKREDIILMSGCGNSRLTEDMFEDGMFACNPLHAILPVVLIHICFSNDRLHIYYQY